MDKKGFTLIEMLVVTIVICIIALIVTPNVTSMLKKGEDDKYNLFLSDVYLATEAYIQKYIDNYPELNTEGGSVYVYMEELVDEKLIKSNLVNPKYCVNLDCKPKKISTCDDNGECIVDDYTIIVTKQDDGTYYYELRNQKIS